MGAWGVHGVRLCRIRGSGTAADACWTCVGRRAYQLAGAAITGGTITVEGCGTDSLQGDVKFAQARCRRVRVTASV